MTTSKIQDLSKIVHVWTMLKMAVPFGTQTKVSVHLRVTFVLEFNKGSGERQEPIVVFTKVSIL